MVATLATQKGASTNHRACYDRCVATDERGLISPTAGNRALLAASARFLRNHETALLVLHDKLGREVALSFHSVSP